MKFIKEFGWTLVAMLPLLMYMDFVLDVGLKEHGFFAVAGLVLCLVFYRMVCSAKCGD